MSEPKSKFRWIWMQLHGSHHAPACPENWLHDHGHFFIGGQHNLDDLGILQHTANMIKVKHGLLERTPAHNVIITKQHTPAPPPGGVYPHLAWAYFNKQRFDDTLCPFIEAVLDADPAAKMMLYVQASHAEYIKVVKHLRQHYRERYVFAYHKCNEEAYIPDDKATPEFEYELWRLAGVAGLRYVSQEAKDYATYAEFEKDNRPNEGDFSMLDRTCGREGIDRVIADAELCLAATIAEDA